MITVIIVQKDVCYAFSTASAVCSAEFFSCYVEVHLRAGAAFHG